MALSDLVARLERAEQRVQSELQGIAVKAANDLVGLVTLRVVNEKLNADNQPFSPYSTTPVPAYLYFGKGRTSSSDRAVSALSKKRESISYKQFREINNLESDRKNFEFTGEMFRKFEVVRSGQQGNTAFAEVGGSTPAAQNKMNWTSQQEGRSVIEWSDSEIQSVQTIFQQWANDIISNG
jgi:hypothetical protein